MVATRSMARQTGGATQTRAEPKPKKIVFDDADADEPATSIWEREDEAERPAAAPTPTPVSDVMEPVSDVMDHASDSDDEGPDAGEISLKDAKRDALAAARSSRQHIQRLRIDEDRFTAERAARRRQERELRQLRQDAKQQDALPEALLAQAASETVASAPKEAPAASKPSMHIRAFPQAPATVLDAAIPYRRQVASSVQVAVVAPPGALAATRLSAGPRAQGFARRALKNAVRQSAGGVRRQKCSSAFVLAQRRGGALQQAPAFFASGQRLGRK